MDNYYGPRKREVNRIYWEVYETGQEEVYETEQEGDEA